MTALTDLALVLIVLTNLRVLGGSRLGACIRAVAFQGLLLGLLPILSRPGGTTAEVLALAATGIAVKALALPYLLFRALRDGEVPREVQPLVGLKLSLGFGVAALGLGAWAAARLPLPGPAPSPLAAPVAFSMLLVGLFLVVSRRKALTQVLGFLILENGVFAFGTFFVRGTPWLVEAGVLLDLLAGVFVMGIALFHINRAFDDIDTDRLARLHDLAAAPEEARAP